MKTLCDDVLRRGPRALPLVAAVLLAGCAKDGTYRRLVRDFEATEAAPYSQHAMAASAMDPASATGTHDTEFLDQVQTTLLETKRRWENALQQPDDGRDALRTGQRDDGHYRDLAHGENLAE